VGDFHPRKQGDLGELSAMEWLASQGACIYTPQGHSPDIDLIAELDGTLLRIEVKTST
jgi:Holliday junction resolvase-like predicted endonuclease